MHVFYIYILYALIRTVITNRYMYIFQHFLLRWNLPQCVLFGGSCMVSFLCVLDWTNIMGAIWSQGWLGSVWILILIRWEVSPCLVCSPWHERHSRPPYRVWMGCFRNYVKMGNITTTHSRVQVELRLITFWVNCWNDVRWRKSLERINSYFHRGILLRVSQVVQLSQFTQKITRWWFQRFFIFTPTRGNDPIWLINIF